MKYRPDIDGLRAVAVLAVILYHAGLAVPGGYVGVDVFFVISGFLITSITAADLSAGKFSLLGFWERRLRRIWPASLVTTFGVLAIGYLVLSPGDYLTTAGDALAQSLMGANIRFWLDLDQGYFSQSADLRPLLHMWSLAVEEQFYILFPFALMAMARWSPRLKICACSVIGIASFAASVGMLASHSQAVFYLLPFRCWELLTGAILALAAPGVENRMEKASLMQRNLIALIGAAGVLVPCFAYGRSTPFPAAAALPPVAGAALLIIAGFGNGARPLVTAILSSAPLCAIGMASYSLYLWHWPAMAFLRHVRGGHLGPRGTAAVLLATVILGWLSWRFVEQPFRKPFSRDRGDLALARGRVVSAAVSVSILLALVSLAIATKGGMPGRFTSEQLHFIEPLGPDAGRFVVIPTWSGPLELPTIGSSSGAGPCFLLLGDSHARMISEALDAAAAERGISGAAAIQDGTFPLPGAWIRGNGRTEEMARHWHRDVLAWIREHRPKHVILCGNWPWYVPYRGSDGLFSEESGIEATDATESTSARPAELFAAGLETMLKVCGEVDAKVWLLHSVPVMRREPKQLAIESRLTGRLVVTEGIDQQTHERWNSAYRTVFGRFFEARLTALDLARPFFNEAERSSVGGNGECWYTDRNHLSAQGVEHFVRPLLEDALEQMQCDWEKHPD